MILSFVVTKLMINLDKQKLLANFVHQIPQKLRIMMLRIVICWAVVLCLVYGFLWFDTIYYKCNLPKMYRKMLDIFTEED